MKKLMKISAALAALTITGVTHAATEGTYAGVGLGYSALKTSTNYMFNTSGIAGASNSHQRGGLGGRLFGGYNFDKYFGLEAAFNSYATSNYKASANGANGSLKYSLDALSFVGKGYLPFDDSGFSAYVLGGVAEVRNQVRYHNNGVALANGVSAGFKNGTTNYYSLRPMYGIGVSYDMAQHVTTNVELSRIQGKGNVKTSAGAIPNADMMTVNLSYNFG